jgi:hypothetical protein
LLAWFSPFCASPGCSNLQETHGKHFSRRNSKGVDAGEITRFIAMAASGGENLIANMLPTAEKLARPLVIESVVPQIRG